MTTVRTVQVTFDCADPARVARFWCTALGYQLPAGATEEAHWSAAEDPRGIGPRLFFQQVPEGKAVKNRLHLDVRVGVGLVGDERRAALEAEGRRLLEHGAEWVELLPADEENESCLVMRDVEGNEFCLD